MDIVDSEHDDEVAPDEHEGDQRQCALDFFKSGWMESEMVYGQRIVVVR